VHLNFLVTSFGYMPAMTAADLYRRLIDAGHAIRPSSDGLPNNANRARALNDGSSGICENRLINSI
jgi:hypothetical protein